MNHFIVSTILSFVLLIPHVSVADDAVLTLDQAVELAVSVNPALAAQGLHAQSMRTIAPQVSSLPDPVVSMRALNVPVDSLSITQENMTQLQLGINQAFPFPGTLALRATAADLLADAALLNVDEFRNQLISRVYGSWWNVFYLDRAMETVERNKQLLRQLISIAETKYKVGKGLQQDVLLAQLELSKLLNVGIQLKATRKGESASLNALLNRPMHQRVLLPLKVDESLPTLAEESTFSALALTSRPLFFQQDQLIASAKTQVLLAEKAYYPDFNLGAAYGFRSGINPVNNRSRADFSSVSLSMTLPFFTGSKQSSHVDQRKAELARSEFLSQDIRVAALAEVARAMADYEQAQQQGLLFKTGIIPQAHQTVASMLAAYQVNKVDFLNLVRAQIILYNYETQYWKSLAEANQSLARLAAAVGVSNATIRGKNHE